eukprot:6247220-Lingulodinium_polyedra.AAC.1
MAAVVRTRVDSASAAYALSTVSVRVRNVRGGLAYVCCHRTCVRVRTLPACVRVRYLSKNLRGRSLHANYEPRSAATSRVRAHFCTYA